MTAASTPRIDLRFLDGEGEARGLLRAIDWSRTALGPPERWPSALRTLVEVIMGSIEPMFVVWGPRRTLLYNEPYVEVLANKHPAMGCDFLEVWDEIRADLEPLVTRAYRGEPTRMDDIPLVMERKGYREQTHWAYSYTPIRGDDGAVGGFLCACHEITQQVFAKRRQAHLLALEARLRAVSTRQEALNAACEALGRALGGVLCSYSEVLENDLDIDVTGEWHVGQVETVLGRHSLASWGAGRAADLLSGKPETVEDVLTDPRTAGEGVKSFEAIGCRSSLTVPFERDGRVQAILSVGVPQPKRWSEDEIMLAREIAERAWQAAERTRAEEQLRALNATLERRVSTALAEKRLTAEIVENTDVFVQVADRDFRWLAINRAAGDEFERVFGVRPKAGDSMLELLADRPEQLAAVRALWARALAGEEFTTMEEFGAPDEGRRFYEIRFNVLRNADGEQVGAYQFVYDVTERMRHAAQLAEAEEARREADALYRAYFEHTPEALFVIGVQPDGGFVIEQINRAHEAGVGFPLSEIRGKRIETVLPSDAAARVLEAYRTVVATGEVLQFREVFDLAGGPQHWDTSIAPVRDAEGRVVRLIGSSRNVTRQVVAEESLRQAQKMEAMGQLTGGVAHDFNNLLTPIVGALDMLQRRQIGGEREQRLIAGAAQSAERARTLVQRLLAFARRQPLRPVPVDVAALIAGMGDLVASTMGPQVRVVVEAADGLPPADADPNQIELALLNLAVNARDAMPDGGTLRITAGMETVDKAHPLGLKPGAYIRLSVADTGVGMDELTLSRAIEPFYSTKGVGKGTGLGLSMVHGLAVQLGGALDIKSRPGLGTNVELWLPKSFKALQAGGVDAEADPVRRTRGVALLVDDDEIVRLSTADMLAELGYAVIEASGGDKALALVDGGLEFDVLITDHLMPGMHGTSLAREVLARRAAAHVLVISGYAALEEIAPELPRLSKPFKRDELAACLATLASRGHS